MNRRETAAVCVSSILIFAAFLILTLNYQHQQDLHKPFVFVDFKTKHWLTYEEALNDVNATIQLEYIVRMDALDKGYTYLGYTFTIEKIGYYEGLELYSVHFQWWAKK